MKSTENCLVVSFESLSTVSRWSKPDEFAEVLTEI